MVVRIRLARFGRRHAPFYNIVVAQARTARNSRPMEVLGTYDPIPKTPLDGETGRKFKDIQLDQVRAKYWLGVGAQPSDPVWRLFSLAGLMEPKYRPGMPLPSVNPAADGKDPIDMVEELEAKAALAKRKSGAAPTKNISAVTDATVPSIGATTEAAQQVEPTEKA